MINNLSKKQEEQIEIYRQKWTDIGLSTKPIDKDKTIESVKWLYSFAGYDKTPYMWCCDSPMQIQLIINLLTDKEFQNLLGNNLWNNLRNNLSSNLRNNLSSNLRNNLWSNLENNNLNFNYCLSPNLESWWVCFYDYILNEIFPERAEEFNNQCKDFYQNVYHIIPFQNICFISERPETLKKDTETRLHSLEGPSLRWKDGYEIFSLDGVNIDKAIFDNVTNKLSAEDILKIQNTEQRLVAMKYFGVENMLPALNAKTIHKNDNGYELLEVTIEGSAEKLLKMQNPSELHKQHYEFVEPHIETCEQAMANRVGLEIFTNPT